MELTPIPDDVPDELLKPRVLRMRYELDEIERLEYVRLVREEGLELGEASAQAREWFLANFQDAIAEHHELRARLERYEIRRAILLDLPLPSS